MQSTAIKKIELMQKITQLSEKKLGEVEAFLKRSVTIGSPTTKTNKFKRNLEK